MNAKAPERWTGIARQKEQSIHWSGPRTGKKQGDPREQGDSPNDRRHRNLCLAVHRNRHEPQIDVILWDDEGQSLVDQGHYTKNDEQNAEYSHGVSLS